MTYDLVALEAEQSINAIMNQFVDRFHINRSDRKHYLTFLTQASFIPELDYDGVRSAVVRVTETLKMIEYNSSGDISEMAKWRRAFEQIGSIMHISRAYPNDAVKRLKKLRETPVKGN